MGFENFNDPEPAGEPVAAPEESSNRTFLIVAAALGGIALLALICIGAYALVFLPRMRTAQEAQRQTLEAQDTEVAMIIEGTSTAAEMTAIVAAYTATPTRTPVPPTFTPTSSPTPVVAQASPDTGAGGVSPDMATATVLYATLHANSTAVVQTLAVASPTPTPGMPTSGFADEVGLPVMLGTAALLIVVIFLARKLRTA